MNRYHAYLLSEKLLHGLALLVHLVAARAERSARLVRMAASVPGAVAEGPRHVDERQGRELPVAGSARAPRPVPLLCRPDVAVPFDVRRRQGARGGRARCRYRVPS